MWMTVGGRRFAITLADTAAARAFAAQLPLTLDMAELNGNEKHADLAVTLPTDTSRPGTIRNGDLMLYGSNTVVVLQPIGDPPDKIRIPDQARSASIKGPVPMIFITRFRLYARTCRLISALTLGSRRHKKCVVPIQALIVPNGCSAVRRRTCIASGLASSRLCILSSRSWPEGARRSGKIVIPFVTHGGYGLGNSQSVLASHAPKALLRDSFSMQADQERQTMEKVTGWLKKQMQ